LFTKNSVGYMGDEMQLGVYYRGVRVFSSGLRPVKTYIVPMGRCRRRDLHFPPNKNTCPRRNHSEAQLVREGLLEQAANKQKLNDVKTKPAAKTYAKIFKVRLVVF
jgi:hypothetical protein